MGYHYTLLIPLLPLAGFVLLGIFGRSFFKNASGIIACLLLLVSAALSLLTAYDYFFVNGKAGGVFQTLIPVDAAWLHFSSTLAINMGILLDPISVMMLVVVTVVSLMVHVFSLAYMKGEERFATYYAFLQLFTFSMLGLVMAGNLFQIYVFWELVGVSSYLLIGYYYDRPTAVAAAKKAFIVTRFADLGFLIGILMLAYYGQALDFQTLLHRFTQAASPQLASATSASFMGISAFTWALTLVFAGGAGKSAMFPLHIWLPDAMEGPTPVSALIHAATMVVAGVYLVARLFPLFSITPATMDVITVVGVFSAAFAAIIACTQTDIKRVLAYSTLSQIGYMMFALGVSRADAEQNLGFTASMFHLFTHAFFKSLLFLCAGAVIHMVHSNEMKDMGGLRKRMPITHLTFLVACLAISGIPPFAGFFSKELILHAALETHAVVYWVGLLTAGLTAFYMFRLYFHIFWNREAQRQDAHGEGSAAMLVPLVVLVACSAGVGFIPFSHFITAGGKPFDLVTSWGSAVLPVAVGLAGIAVAYALYHKQSDRADRMAAALGGFYHAAYHKFYVDELYLFVTKKVMFNLVGRPAAWVDRHVVDGTMNGIAKTTSGISHAIRGLQSGKVQGYAIYFFGGIVVLVVILVYWWK